MAVNILVTEDESIVRKDIERSLQKLGYNVIGSADTGEKAIELAKDLKPDLALMDIMLKGDMTGIEAAQQIKKDRDIPVIFLTAYADEKTLNKAKITEPHGYILKPFKEIDIHTSIEMAMHKHGREKELKIESDLLKSIAAAKEDAEYLFLKHQSKLVRVNPSDIQFVEAMKDYVLVNTIHAKYTIHSTMKDIQAKLSAPNFLRVHRSFIINLDRIEAIQNSEIQLDGLDKTIPIGGSYKDQLGSKINLL